MRAETPAVTIDSQGVPLLGVLHLPAGEGPHPVVVLLHGFPGNERNFDLAQTLRSAGYAALVFHYRGSWGVGGDWSWGNALADGSAVLRAVRGEFGARHRLDPRRVALAGHSMGGFVALMTAAAEPSVAAVASVSGYDFGAVAAALDEAGRAELAGIFQEELLPLRGTSGPALVAEMVAAGAAWRLDALAARLAGRPVLLVGSGQDPVSPAAVHHRPLVTAYAGARLEHHEWATDHALSDRRTDLAATLRGFLDRSL